MGRVSRVLWAEGSDLYGAAGVFGAAPFDPAFRDLVDDLILAGGSANPLAVFVDCERRASDLEMSMELGAMQPAFDLEARNADPLYQFWRQAANAGAAAALRIVADRLSQHSTLVREAGEA